MGLHSFGVVVQWAGSAGRSVPETAGENRVVTHDTKPEKGNKHES